MQPQSPTPTPLSSVKRPTDDLMGVPKQVWVIASILAMLMAACYLGYIAWDRAHDLQEARNQLKDARAQLEKAKADSSKLEADWKDKLAQTDAQMEVLRKEREANATARKSFEDEMRAALENKDVTISQLQGKLTVNILDRVMFESGEAVLKPDGEAVLLKVATVLKQYPSLMVHVVGHTDNVPIRLGARSRFASNWELSTARALAAVRFLSEKGGVDPRRLGAVGYGEFHPIAENTTSQGRARNRRIAITVVSDEIVGSDAVATASVLRTNVPSAIVTNAVVTPLNPAPAASSNVISTNSPAVTNSAPVPAAEPPVENPAVGESATMQ